MLNVSLVDTGPVIPIELRASGTDDIFGVRVTDLEAESFLPIEISVIIKYAVYTEFYYVNATSFNAKEFFRPC